jgi:hypothetical protein
LYKVYGIKSQESTSNETTERQYEEISSFRPSVLDSYITDEFEEDRIVEKYNKENPHKKIKICNLLFLSKDSTSASGNWCGAPENNTSFEDKNHLMYIIDFQKFTKCHVCPKCGNYCLSASDNGCYNKKRFERHVAKFYW